MKKLLSAMFLLLFLMNSGICQDLKEIVPPLSNGLRAPAYPLVTIDPYTSVWSFTDNLYDENPRHWTGTTRRFLGVLRVDNKVYRFMGSEEIPLYPVIYTADLEPWNCRYTQEKPDEGWEKISFDDAKWKEGKGAFGSRRNAVSTQWRSEDLWIRREITLNEDISTTDLLARYSCDDMIELYINGILVVKTVPPGKMNATEQLSAEVKNSIKKGKNVIAAHCYNGSGNSFADFGLYRPTGNKKYFEQTAVQKSVSVMPTQTYYVFECGPVKLDVIFTSPLLMSDLDLLSRPVSFITWQGRSLDGKNHNVQIYFETTPEWAVNTINQPVMTERIARNELIYLKTGTVEQPVLGKKGDDLRIDWGYFYLTGKQDKSVSMSIGDIYKLKEEFVSNGKLSNSFDNSKEYKLFLSTPALSYSRDHGKAGKKVFGGHIMTGYDDIMSIQYFGDNLPAYWKKNGITDISDVFDEAENTYSAVMEKCSAFDKQLMADAEAAGGTKYAELCALAYRQSIAAHKLVKDKTGEILFLSKENFSNGCIGTVDVTYPSAPLYLLYNPELLKGMLNGIFYFSESGKWTKPFAAHDIGTYPLANGQLYGEDMPVEEAGNMLILTTAIAVMEGNADYAGKHWNTLSTWANYLLENGLDPANQLCTDDFAGHLAHNANLSVKAIMGIAGYGKLAGMLGKTDLEVIYKQNAEKMARQWIEMDFEDDHFRLTFDQTDTWSQKYNLVWDKLLKLNIFPDSVASKEIAWYLKKQLTYGLPLDSRKTYTKSDWVLWTAVLADDTETFIRLTDPIWKYANETQTRMPLSDWHETTNGRSVGFRARSVVGGYFMKMLEYKIKTSRK